MNLFETKKRQWINYFTFFLLGIFLLIGEGCDKRLSQQERVREGRQLYLGNGCAVCHGKTGRGDGLASQTFYPLPTDFQNIEAYKQGSSLKAIGRTIKNGVRQVESGMPAFDHLTKEELEKLAYYLKSLQKDLSIFQEDEK